MSLLMMFKQKGQVLTRRKNSCLGRPVGVINRDKMLELEFDPAFSLALARFPCIGNWLNRVGTDLIIDGTGEGKDGFDELLGLGVDSSTATLRFCEDGLLDTLRFGVDGPTDVEWLGVVKTANRALKAS